MDVIKFRELFLKSSFYFTSHSFFSKLDDLIKKHVPLKKVSNKQRKSKGWITKGIRRSIQQTKKNLKAIHKCEKQQIQTAVF